MLFYHSAFFEKTDLVVAFPCLMTFTKPEIRKAIASYKLSTSDWLDAVF